MEEPLTHTAFEKGTHLYHALQIVGPAGKFQTKLMFAIPIRDDPSEAWLRTYPADKQISRELAAATLEQVAKSERELTERLRERRLLEARRKLQLEIDRLTNEIQCHERIYADELSIILERQPTAADLHEVDKLYEGAEKASEANRLENPSRLAEILKEKKKDWIEGRDTFDDSSQSATSVSVLPTQAERDAKELAEYRGYRALINRIEGKNRK